MSRINATGMTHFVSDTCGTVWHFLSSIHLSSQIEKKICLPLHVHSSQPPHHWIMDNVVIPIRLLPEECCTGGWFKPSCRMQPAVKIAVSIPSFGPNEKNVAARYLVINNEVARHRVRAQFHNFHADSSYYAPAGRLHFSWTSATYPTAGKEGYCFTKSHTLTQKVGRTPLGETTLTTYIHSLGGIRTRNPSKRVPQTLALDRSATGKGVRSYTITNFWHQQLSYLSVFRSPVSGKCILQSSLLVLPSTCTK